MPLNDTGASGVPFPPLVLFRNKFGITLLIFVRIISRSSESVAQDLNVPMVQVVMEVSLYFDFCSFVMFDFQPTVRAQSL